MVAGHAITPQEREAAARLHHYWVAGAGLKRWASSPHPWQALHDALALYIHNPELLDETTSAWHNEIMPATGGDAYRLAHGGKIRGNRIGPG